MIIIYMSLGHINNYHLAIIILENEASTTAIRTILNLKLEMLLYCIIIKLIDKY
jgi:hypothetical protein